MKIQIRRGTFETNSSSVHSITMCIKSDFDRWIRGELIWDKWNDKLVEITPEIENDMQSGYSKYLTYEQFNDWDYIEFETFEESFTTPGNEDVVSFGYYGHD